MRTVFILLISQLLFSTFAIGQVLDSLLNKSENYIIQTASRNDVIDTIIRINTYCLGEIIPFEEIKKGSYRLACRSKEFEPYHQVYVIFSGETGSYIKRFDSCYEFEELTLKGKSTEFYNTYSIQILNSMIQPEFVEIIKGDTISYTKTPHHTCFTTISWFSDTTILRSTSFTLEDYLEERRDEGDQNPKAAQNRDTPLIIWYELLIAEIKNLENTQKFTKTKHN